MQNIIFEYVDFNSEKFKLASDLRYNVLFAPFHNIEKYHADELDEISYHLVAICDGKVIGYSRLTEVNGKGKISNVAVDSNYLNRGIGHEMLRQHFKKAKSHNIQCVYLDSRVTVIPFYEKIGFESKGSVFVSDKSGIELQRMVKILE